MPGEEALDGPKECQPPSDLPPLCAEKPEEAKFPELRPPLKREEPLPLPKECQRPSLIPERKFDEWLPKERLVNERLPNDPESRPDENPRP
jgi:hypothetical protein